MPPPSLPPPPFAVENTPRLHSSSSFYHQKDFIFCPHTLAYVARPPHPPRQDRHLFQGRRGGRRKGSPSLTIGASAAGGAAAAGEAAAAALRPVAPRTYTAVAGPQTAFFFHLLIPFNSHNHVRLRDGAPQTAAARYVGLT